MPAFFYVRLRSSQAEPELAELLDARGQPVARLEPHLLLLRIAADHALRRAGEHDIARLERHQLRGVAHQLRAVEHHVVGVRRLAHLAVDLALDLQVVRVADQIGGDEIRSEQREAVAGLADHPLAAAALEIAGAEIVAVRVAEDVGQRLDLAHVPRAPADHDHELRFVVEALGRDARHAHGAEMTVQRVVVLVEEDRQLGDRLTDLARVPRVVEADAQDLLRVGDAWPEVDVGLLQEQPFRVRSRHRPADQVGQPLVAARDQGVHRGRRIALQRLYRSLHVQNAALGLDAQAVGLAVSQGEQRQVPRHRRRGRLRTVARPRRAYVFGLERSGAARYGDRGRYASLLEKGPPLRIHRRLL